MAAVNAKDEDEGQKSKKGFLGNATAGLRRAGSFIGKAFSDDKSSTVLRTLGVVLIAAGAVAALSGVGLPAAGMLMVAGGGLLWAGKKSKENRLQRAAQENWSSARQEQQGPSWGPQNQNQYQEVQNTAPSQQNINMQILETLQAIQAQQQGPQQQARYNTVSPLERLETQNVSAGKPKIVESPQKLESEASIFEYYQPSQKADERQRREMYTPDRPPTPMPMKMPMSSTVPPTVPNPMPAKASANIAVHVRNFSPQPQGPGENSSASTPISPMSPTPSAQSRSKARGK